MVNNNNNILIISITVVMHIKTVFNNVLCIELVQIGKGALGPKLS